MKGYKQQYGTDYTHIFASVAKTLAYKTVISYATQFDLEIEQMDVITAFLQGDLNEELYVEQPHGFRTNDQVCKLQKALYGLKQAPRCWQIKLKNVLGQAGLYPLHSDECIFFNHTTGIIVVTYVDDFLIVGSSKTSI